MQLPVSQRATSRTGRPAAAAWSKISRAMFSMVLDAKERRFH